jgi:hypothetical protein
MATTTHLTNQGNQTISGNLQVSGTGIFNALDLNAIDVLTLSGVDVTITSGVVSLTNPLSAPNLVYNTGDQTISGVKTFLNDLNISGDLTLNGGLYINDIEELNLTGANIYADNLVYNSGDQSITGTKIFVGALGLGNITAPNSNKLYFYDTGTAAYNTIETYSDELLSYTIFELSDQGFTNKISIDLVSKTISGANNSAINFSNRPTVNNTGVLLSGQNFFIINLYNNTDTQLAGHNYFGNLSIGFSNSQNNRRFPILENCVIRKASWTQTNGTVGNPSLNSTGYFINTTTNTTGIISTTINTQNTNTPTHYIAQFSPSIAVSSGDYIVCSLFGPTYATTFPASVRNSVNLYCYN